MNLMEHLKDIRVGDLSFEVTRDGGYSKKRYDSYTVMLKVTNNGDTETEFKLRVRYTSILFGLMVDDYKDSDNMVSVLYSTFKISPVSPGMIKIRFDEITNIYDGDRMEFEINERTKMLLVRKGGEWFVNAKQIQSPLGFSLHPELESRIEHFESIEGRMGIAIQNFSIKNCNDETLYIDFEILAANDDYYKKPFFIYAIIYDRNNNIVRMERDFTGNDGFKGYGKFSAIFRNFAFPISEIGLIRIYPA